MSKPKLVHILSKDDDDACMARWRRTPRTRAVRVLPADATDEEWLAGRRAGIGASELASVLGVPGAYTSPFSLWWAKKLGWESDSDEAMRIGSKLEPLVGEMFAERRPDLALFRTDGRLWQHWQHPWMLATPDFVAVDETGRLEPVECKTDEGGTGWGQPGTDEVPVKHRVQLLVQCAVLGAERGHLVRLAGKRLTAYTVDALDETVTRPDDPEQLDGWAPTEWELWVSVGERFMGSLALDVPPDPDDHPQTEQALQRLYPAPADDDDTGPVAAYLDDEVCNEFVLAHNALAAAQARFDLARNVARAQLGAAKQGRRVSDATLVLERRVYKRGAYAVGPGVVDQIVRRTWT